MISRLRACALILLPFLPLMANAGACNEPQFTEFVPAAIVPPQNELVAVELSLQPVASVKLPTGFTKWGSQPYGSVVFGNHPNHIKGGIAYETMETVKPLRANTTPADFYRSIFHGLNQTGCKYLAALQLNTQDYRLHILLGDNEDAEVFAYGKGNRHHFYVIRTDRPNFVLNGFIQGVDQAGFETILSTIKLQ